ncbi:collagen binding domain-containing protein [Listeria welshimeri]|uniref:SpaA isopeptide-forming pilin-related protein n=1 Tax=Listeria welshimeri TaxID=1643 RepID=UPI00162404D5|nr:SpaA isopeptide-forming pilin-related protein [Listeria welshimeri]MBC2065062.1 collagen binding domain-containing protein [Listeria welshimeri]MBC2083359.1 collagen binding domain-containing protein [Listeria welshimeri]MBF2369689.1 collagen binding domain-containing protein [Listeria welshimeri]MBF2413559.1 collagen binding domain-containing protein [Listeria welshimeri]
MKERTKMKNSLKKVGLAFLSVILLVNVIFQTNFVKAATDYGSDFLQSVELLDGDGNPKTEFGYYDSIQIHYTWAIPNSTSVKEGDTMQFVLPQELKIVTDLNFDLKDHNGNTVGNVVATKSTGKVVITFTDFVEKNSDISGYLDFWSNWDKSLVDGNEKVPLDFPVNGKVDTITVDVGSENQISPDETLYKYGWANAKDPSVIQWVVRLNYAKVDIQNAVYEDFVGPNQVIDFNSIKAFHGEFDPNDNFTPGVAVPSSDIIQTANGFKINLGHLTDSVKVSYYTNSTDNGASPSYTNKGELTGDNYQSQQIEVNTPTSGGSGGGEGTNGSVELTKIDNSDQKNPLEGAEFKLVNSAGTTIQEGIKTGTDGKLTISSLKYDTYKLIETKAPAGYILDTKPVEFTIDNEHQSLFVSKENAPMKGSVSLVKTDKETGATLEGAEFELQDETGNTLQTGLKTNADGVLTVDNLAFGDYKFVETKAPANYILDATPILFTIDETHQKVTVSKENTSIKGSVSLVKIDSETKEKLAGAEFELQDENGETLRTNLKTNEDGMLYVDDLLPGNYQFVETKSPAGYILDTTPVKFEIEIDNKQIGLLVTKENTKKPETPEIPNIPDEPTIPKAPSNPKKPDTIVSSSNHSQTLPKTGDSPLINGLGLLLVAISTGGLLIFRRKQ